MLDPENLDDFRALAHRMLDEAINEIAQIRDQPAWRPIPPEIKAQIEETALPYKGLPLAQVYQDYQHWVAPYSTGNRHPRFMGWVHGNGTPSGMVAQMLAAALNANVGGREHAAVYIERKVIAWWAEIFGFPVQSSGIVTSGTSIATLLAVLVARTKALGHRVRATGMGHTRLVGYASTAVHHCVGKAFEIAGLGHDALRRIPLDQQGRLDVNELHKALVADRALGLQPCMLIGTAGTVDRGITDDLPGLAAVAQAEDLWFHVDGAFGAMAILAPQRRAALKGIEQADSLAMDFHKWMHVPYGAGLMLTRHEGLHRATFADQVHYLARQTQGTAGGQPWFCDYGPELSRGFSALSVWMTMREFGLERIGAAIEHDCRIALHLGRLLAEVPGMRVIEPIPLNIVCACYEAVGLEAKEVDELNEALVIELQTSGVAVPSTTRVDDRLVMRFNFTNHRVEESDLLVVVAKIKSILASRNEGAGSPVV